MSEAGAHRIRYSGHNCKCVEAAEPRLASSERRQLVKTVKLNHLRAALLTVLAAGLLAAVGLLVVLYAQPA